MFPLTFRFEAIGTSWQIDIFTGPATLSTTTLEQTIKTRIAEYDQTYSRFRDDSWIMTIGKRPGTYPLPADARPLFDIYAQLYRDTNGAFTPLIGQVLVDAGYDAIYSLQTKQVQPPLTWDEALAYTPPSITTKQPTIIDIGAAGKGYLIDIVAQLLRDHDCTSFCVDAGGDIWFEPGTHEPLSIGLEHPDDTTSVVGVVKLSQGSICGSAGNRRAWGPYHHIIDPRTLSSPRQILSTWVMAKTTMLADALSTCLFLVPANHLQPKYDFAYAILFADYHMEHSKNFPADLFTSG
jgi:thiamine biosynthesis lipoprotein